MDLADRLSERAGSAESLCAGREAELARVRALYDEAASRRTGRVALVVGGAGVGKSRLMAEVLRRFRAAGVPVFDGRCRPGGVAYEPFLDVAQGALGHLADAGADGETLARIAEVTAALRGQVPPLATGVRAGHDLRLGFFERVREVLACAARPRPPVILLHDVELADGATRSLLAYVLRTLAPAAGMDLDEPSAALFVLCTRDGERASWLEDVAVERIPLGGLDRDGVRDYLSSPAVIDRFLRASDGIPRKLETLLEQPLPDADAVARERVRALGATAGRVLGALALYGRPAGPVLLERLTTAVGGAPDEIGPTVRALAESPLLTRSVVAGELRVGFARGEDREAVIRVLGGDRVMLHRAVGDVLLARGGVSDDPAACAEHLLSGEAGERAVDAALVAGDALERSLAYERAATLYARALDATTRPEVAATLEERLADLHELCGEYGRALEAARRLLARHPDDAQAHGRVGHLHLLRGDFSAARAALGKARELAEAGGAVAVWVSVLADSAEAHFLAGEHDAAIEAGTAAIARSACSIGIDTVRARVAARNAVGKVHLERGTYDDAAALFRENLVEARAAAMPHEVTRALINLGISALRRGDWSAAEAHYREGLAAARESGDLRHRAFCLQNLGVLAQWRRDYSAALAHYQGAVSAFKRLGHRPWLAWVALDLGDLYLGLGDPRRAEAMADLAERLGGESPPPTTAVILENLRGRIGVERGELGEARRRFDGALTRARRIPNRDELSLTLLNLARLDLAEGETDAALARLADVPAPTPQKIEAQLRVLRAEAQLQKGSAAAARLDLAAAERAYLELGDEEGRLRALLLGMRAAERAGDLRGARVAREAARELDDALRLRVPAEFAASYGLDALRATLRDAAAPAGAPAAISAPFAALPPVGAKPRPAPLARIVGESGTLRHVLEMIERVAPHESLVLIRGESGTGKELVAEAIHELSSRRGRPFVKVNCGALVESLLLSELFGHERGAFTGALARRKGRFELADGGTIFLDEIGDISPQTQVALLRVLQEREFERVGGTQSIRVDVRIVCATNRDLEAMVADGRFREDLYYRLKGIELELPPLRERGADVLELARFFLGQVAREHGTAPKRLSADAQQALLRHSWPGNVRELENVIRSVTLLADGDEVTVTDVAEYLTQSTGGPRVDRHWAAASAPPVAPAPAVTGPDDLSDIYGRALKSGLSLRELKRRIELECITRALSDAGGNITRAADKLGMKRPRLSQLLKEHGIKETALSSASRTGTEE